MNNVKSRVECFFVNGNKVDWKLILTPEMKVIIKWIPLKNGGRFAYGFVYGESPPIYPVINGFGCDITIGIGQRDESFNDSL